MRRYEAWRRDPKRIAAKVLLWLVVTVMVAAGALGGGVWLYLNESVAAIRASDPEVKKAEEVLEAPPPGEPTTALIVGYDKRFGDDSDPGRADTTMLLRVNPENDTLTMLSFPRDLVVDHPGCQGHSPWRDKLNTAYAYCGPSGVVRTVRELTGVPINYLIVVNFRAFKQIVNKVGGVYVDVDRRYFNDNGGPDGYATINLQPGYQRLTGGAALDYARFRHTDSDIHRSARQQQFVKALKQQIAASFSVFKLPGIINTIVDNVEVGKGGKKQLDLDTVLGYARLIYDLPSGHFYQVRIGGLEGYAELTTDSTNIQEAVREFLNPDVEAAAKATAVAIGQRPKADQAPRPSQVSIEVLNGNGVDGSASEAAAELAARGYRAASGGNAPSYDYFQTRVLYDPAKAGAKVAAQAVADLFGDAEVQAGSAGTSFDTMLRVIVGKTFLGNLAPAPADTTPERQAPSVEPVDVADVAPLLRDARSQAGFPLLVPTVRALGSYLDTEVPVRAYSVNRHPAVKIVFRRGNGSYWGIEETTWADAPILDGANEERTIDGRRYRLYFDGTKLHMVALEANGAVYWVTNTILDELSNETMLAIAKGLKPLASAQ